MIARQAAWQPEWIRSSDFSWNVSFPGQRLGYPLRRVLPTRSKTEMADDALPKHLLRFIDRLRPRT